jgi:hypothetical protein
MDVDPAAQHSGEGRRSHGIVVGAQRLLFDSGQSEHLPRRQLHPALRIFARRRKHRGRIYVADQRRNFYNF